MGQTSWKARMEHLESILVGMTRLAQLREEGALPGILNTKE